MKSLLLVVIVCVKIPKALKLFLSRNLVVGGGSKAFMLWNSTIDVKYYVECGKYHSLA